jgi:hypothetical protein
MVADQTSSQPLNRGHILWPLLFTAVRLSCAVAEPAGCYKSANQAAGLATSCRTAHNHAAVMRGKQALNIIDYPEVAARHHVRRMWHRHVGGLVQILAAWCLHCQLADTYSVDGIASVVNHMYAF